MPKVMVEPGVEIYYEEFGSGEHYVFCMQIDHDRTKYSLERELAKRGFHVFLLTNRGYGQSTHDVPEQGMYWYDRFADDVIAFADHLGVDKFVYSGASHGSGVGWHLAMNHPERLVCFFAVVAGPLSPDEFGGPRPGEPLPPPPAKEEPKEASKEPEVLPPGFVMPTTDERLLERRRQNREKERALRARPDYQAVYESPETQRINFGPAMLRLENEENLQAVLSTIQVPVLMLGGMDDVCSRPDLMMRTAKCLPNCKLIVHSSFGHAVDIFEDLASDAQRFYQNLLDTGRYYDPVVNEA